MPLETPYWPTELLELLFTFVAEDAVLNSDGLLTTLLCVCSRWRDIGTRTIWTNITLNPTKLASFTDSTTGSTYHSLVRSLTLLIPHIKPALTGAWNYADGPPPFEIYLEDPFTLVPRGNDGTRRLWENLSKLAVILPRMTAMTSFSFYVTEQSSEFRYAYGFWLRRSDLQAILEALPETVTDIEVDTKGFDQCYSHDKHMCPQIASLISKCKNIRIRLSRMCTEVIPTNIDNKQLESVVINLLQPDHHAATKDCGMVEDDDRRTGTTSFVVERCIMLRQCLTFKLRFVKQDCPSLKCLRLIDSVGESLPPKPGFSTINIRDFLAENTISYPLCLLQPTRVVDNKYALRTMKEGSCQDSCGKFEELEQTIEGSPWVETVAGNRLALINASSHAQRQFKLKDFTLEEPSVYQARSGISCELWDLERRAGRTLLFTREVEGFPDVEVLEREILEDEGSEESQSDDGEGSVWLFDFDDDLGDEDPSLGHPWQ